MKLLIVGSTGFIGKNLINILKIDKKNILSLNYRNIDNNLNNSLNYHKNSKNEIFNKIKNFKPSVIVYLAWYGIPNFSNINCKKNLKNAKDFVDFISNLQSLKKIIFSGTCLEYLKKNGICNEKSYMNHKTNFSKTKNQIRKYALTKLKKRNISLIWFRIFYVYGNFQRDNSLIPSIILSIKQNKKIILNSPNTNLDFIHISDVIKIMKKAIYYNIPTGIYNLGTGKTSNIMEIANLIKSKIGYNKDILIKNKNNLSKQKKISFYADISKTMRIFNYSKFKSINDGIMDMLKT